LAEQLSRRQALAAAGLLALAATGCGGDDEPATTSASVPATTAEDMCVLTPEQTEGPYYVADAMVRRDVTEGREGVPLRLDLTVKQTESCEAIAGATVEIWHCDADGVYSGVSGDSGTFLRGAQRTGADGVATFDTIYPGWYQGRTTHIHVKVHVGGDEVHTGQLYFDDDSSAAVWREQPYERRGAADTTNATDGIYSQGGAESTLALERAGDGYAGTFTLGVSA
jgi:protocatechuate 3,4-dioxygenase beta subunit